MPIVKAYPNGVTLGSPGGNPDPPKRGTVRGWSPAAARRNTKWLYSVNTPELTGYGIALTLTVGILPESEKHWAALRDVYRKWLYRNGAIRDHWVNEWQERLVPHLHFSIYFKERPTPVQKAALMLKWLQMTSHLQSGSRGQHIEDIDGVVGWLKYVAKHASRGAKHYQRQAGLFPDSWQTSGRQWGYGGDWPLLEPVEARLDGSQAARFRRLAKSYAIAQARSAGDFRRVKYLRRMLKNPDFQASRFRGMSEWIPETVVLRLLDIV